MTSRIAYLAEPIDYVGDIDRTEAIRILDTLSALGWVVYRPAGAWAVSAIAEPGYEIEAVNRNILAQAGLVVGWLPSGSRSIGVPREIEYAVANKKAVAVVTDRMGWALHDVPGFSNSNAFSAWCPTPEQAGQWYPSHRDLAFFLSHPDAVLPTRAYPGDAGFDLTVVESVEVCPGEFKDIPCGIRVALPSDVWARITGRSSTLRKHGLQVTEGIIDAGYRGELHTGVWNLADRPVQVKAGTRLAQMVLHRNDSAGFVAVGVSSDAFADIPGDGRADNGFGSTGL